MRNAAMVVLALALGCSRPGQPVAKDAAGVERIEAPTEAPPELVTSSLAVPTTIATAGEVQGKDSAVRSTVPRRGGSVTLPGFATVRFPSGAFSVSQLVRVAATSDSATRATLDVTAATEAAPPLPYEIRINTGPVAPATSIEVAIPIPESYLSSLPPGRTVQLYAQLVSGGQQELLDLFEPFSATFDPATRILRAQLPNRIFDDGRRPDNTFEAVLMVASQAR